VSGAGEGEVVNKEVGEEERRARMSGQDKATSVDVEIDPPPALPPSWTGLGAAATRTTPYP